MNEFTGNEKPEVRLRGLKQPLSGSEDLNGDGVVDNSDLSMVVLNFGMGCG